MNKPLAKIILGLVMVLSIYVIVDFTLISPIYDVEYDSSTKRLNYIKGSFLPANLKVNYGDEVVFTKKVFNFKGSIPLNLKEEGNYNISINNSIFDDSKQILIDRTPPMMQIQAPNISNSEVVELSIYTNEISKLFVNNILVDKKQPNIKNIKNIELFTNGSQTKYNFEIILVEGQNLFDLKAVDTQGNQTNDEVIVYKDSQPPKFEITNDIKENIYTKILPLDIKFSNFEDVKSVSINGANKEINQSGTISEKVNLVLGKNNIIIEAEDTAGNKSKSELIITRVPEKFKIPILMYHRIGYQIDDRNTTSPENLENQFRYLSQNNYNTISFAQLNDYLYRDIPLPSNPIIISFDDGYLSAYKYAYPLLRKYGLTASFGIVTGFVGDYNGSSRDYMNWTEIRNMHNNGIEIVSHTHRHLILPRYSEDIIKYELNKSRQLIKDNLGFTTDILIYPHGLTDEKVVKILKDLGWESARTTEETLSFTSEDKYRLPVFRVSSYTTIQDFDF